MDKISIIIPVYNERDSVKELAREVKDVLEREKLEREIIFIDDGSTDDTLDILQKISGIKIIALARNFGKSQALQAGFDIAQGKTLVTLDGDLQDDPKEIVRFIEKLSEGYDLVCGWKRKRVDPLSKRFFSKIANTVNRIATGVKIHDMNCGFKAFRGSVAKNLDLYGDMHRYIPAVVFGAGYKVAEIEVNHRRRRYGKSKYGILRIFWGFFDFTTLLFLKKFFDRPLHFFGFAGLASGAIGLVILAYLSWIRLVNQILIGGRPLLLLGVLLVLVGLQFFSLGLVGELIIRQNTKKERRYVIDKIISYEDESQE